MKNVTTIGDMIRSMSDEELAKFIWDTVEENQHGIIYGEFRLSPTISSLKINDEDDLTDLLGRIYDKPKLNKATYESIMVSVDKKSESAVLSSAWDDSQRTTVISVNNLKDILNKFIVEDERK